MSTARSARVLITGAARGMGEKYAERSVDEGARLVWMWDKDGRRLASTAERLRAKAGESEIRTLDIDLTDPSAIDAAIDDVREAGGVDVLINNAGLVAGGPYWEQEAARTEAIMAVNILAPLRITAGLLPLMIAQAPRPARILNVASAAGTLANPGMSVYVASKWAMIGWSESVRLELKRAGHGHVRVTTLAPSYVDTGMFDGVTPPVLTPLLNPDDVVETGWRALMAGKPLVMMPWTVRLGAALRGILPQRAWDVVADKGFGVYDSMRLYTGRTG